MKRQLTILTFLITFVLFANGQSIIYSDSLNIIKSIDQVFKTFESGDFKEFKEISTTEIYCILCEGTLDSKLGPYIIKQDDFYNKYLNSIKNFESWKRAKNSKELILVQENNSRSDITAYITTWKKNEYAEGHEGAQLGIYFKKINGEFKFAGIETIP